jgi:hypothetical protein
MEDLIAKFVSKVFEKKREEYYQLFLKVLAENQIFVGDLRPLGKAFPVCLYRNFLSYTKTFAILYEGEILIDILPSASNPDSARIGRLNNRSIKFANYRKAKLGERFNIHNCEKMIEIKYLHQGKKEMKFKLFAEYRGIRGMTQDFEATNIIWNYLEKTKNANQ